MHHYRQALLRIRQGDSDRDIAAARVVGRPKAAQWRHIARAKGWLDLALPLPDDEAIAAVLQGPHRVSSTVSTLEGHIERLSAWAEQGVSASPFMRRCAASTAGSEATRPCAACWQTSASRGAARDHLPARLRAR